MEDYKHFLPRICELMLLGNGHPFDLETLAWKLADSQWRLWPAAEQGGLTALLHETWAWLLQSSVTEPFDLESLSADHFLRAVSRVMDVSPFLATWRPNSSLHHLDHLGKLIFEHIPDVGSPSLLGASWDWPLDESDRLTRWVVHDQPYTTLEQALTDYARRWNPEVLPEYSQRLHAAYAVTLLRKADDAP